jgi:hypothetical protein
MYSTSYRVLDPTFCSVVVVVKNRSSTVKDVVDDTFNVPPAVPTHTDDSREPLLALSVVVAVTCAEPLKPLLTNLQPITETSAADSHTSDALEEQHLADVHPVIATHRLSAAVGLVLYSTLQPSSGEPGRK